MAFVAGVAKFVWRVRFEPQHMIVREKGCMALAVAAAVMGVGVQCA